MKYLLLIVFILTNLYALNEKVVLQLAWKHQFQFAGFYVAKELGYYDEIGLDVTINEFDNSINIVNDVVSGKATFGIGWSSLLLSLAAKKPVVLLGATYQSSPSVLITTNPDIQQMSDLMNKKVMITSDAVVSASLIAMLKQNKITKNDLELQPHSFDYNDLLNGTTDAMACYLSNEAYYFKKKGIDYKVYNPKDYGYDFYGDILFTSENELNNHHERVGAFVGASKKAWLWAFENIEKTAEIIYKNYNRQNKSLESLIYEGKVLKELALVKDIPFGQISVKKLEEIAQIYKFAGLLDPSFKVSEHAQYIKHNKAKVKIGVLAKRGIEVTHERWDSLAEYLNQSLDIYDFSVVPLDFEQLEVAVKEKSIDFVITNTTYYVYLENKYGVSRIATLINSNGNNQHPIKEFGGVVFTRSDNKKINTIEDLENSSFGAVSKLSFGGWIMGYEELFEHGIDSSDLDIKFLNTHDAVVDAVLSGEIDAGTVRTDTLERMELEGKIDISKIKVLGAKKYNDFPYLVSTKLYPEWPIAKLSEADDHLANHLLAELLKYVPNVKQLEKNKIAAWTVPLDYSSVHNLLRELRLPPYDTLELKLSDIVEQYRFYVYLIVLFMSLLIARLIYDWRVRSYLNEYNLRLDKDVQTKTQELLDANRKLKEMAHKDYLTGISNRAYFMNFAKKYFDIAKRNGESLNVLSLDIDHFKNINDTYGHKTGDDVLVEFTKVISKRLRKSDIFGRIGGEEFCILLQNTPLEGTYVFAKSLCGAIENMIVISDGNKVHITVSIGMAELSDEENVEDLIKKSDIALYDAKESGRNQVKVYLQS